MRLFQYEWDDGSVSIVAAEDKEEAHDLLLEFGKNILSDKLLPLKNLLLTLYPSKENNKVCWQLETMGFNTILELPFIEAEEQPKQAKVFNLCLLKD